MSRFVGETEKNVRDLFADAEQDQRTRGMRDMVVKFSSINLIGNVFEIPTGSKII